MPNSQQRLVSVAVTDGVSAWERHDLLLMLLLMLLGAAGWEALGLRFTVAVAVTIIADISFIGLYKVLQGFIRLR